MSMLTIAVYCGGMHTRSHALHKNADVFMSLHVTHMYIFTATEFLLT